MDTNLDYRIRIIPEGVSEIEKLPALIGGVERAVESVNSAANNREGFRKGAETADKLEKEIKEIGSASRKAGGEVFICSKISNA